MVGRAISRSSQGIVCFRGCLNGQQIRAHPKIDRGLAPYVQQRESWTLRRAPIASARLEPPIDSTQNQARNILKCKPRCSLSEEVSHDNTATRGPSRRYRAGYSNVNG